MIAPSIKTVRALIVCLACVWATLPAESSASATVEIALCPDRPTARGCAERTIEHRRRGQDAFVHFTVIRAQALDTTLSQTMNLYDANGNAVFVSEPLLVFEDGSSVHQGINRLRTDGLLPGQYRIELSFHGDDGRLQALADTSLRVDAPANQGGSR